MKIHANAALTLRQRRRMVCLVVDDGWSIAEAAAEHRTSEKTCGKWVSRYRAEGECGLADRSSAPRVQARATPERTITAIAALRRLRMTGPEIAEVLGLPLSTVSGILTRIGLGRLGRIGLEPARRYEKQRPGELLHVDVKKLGRIQGGAGKRARDGLRRHYTPTLTDRGGVRRKTVGWEYVHVCVDDYSRVAYVEVLGDEKAHTAVGFLTRAVAFYAARGVRVEAVMTDNGGCYRSAVHAVACRTLGLRHKRTRAYRPQTNGKAERFIRTMLGGWAYGAIYASSRERTAALDAWLHHYNHHRKHTAIGRRPPITRLNNLIGTYT